MTSVAVLGSSGFLGRHVADALQKRGALVRPLRAPRVRSGARDLNGLEKDLSGRHDIVAALAESIREVDAVVNAAGFATATSAGDDALFGANALLPGLVARACASRGTRFIHVSSAAVQGRRPILDESTQVEPFSPYSASKALGEGMVLGSGSAVIYRPTSVHGSRRSVTHSLRRYASSWMSSVASPGSDPTPQVQVTNVADAVAFLAVDAGPQPRIVLHPSEGLTTSRLLQLLGDREPRALPRPPARLIVEALAVAGRASGRIAGVARRLEIVWFGQAQVPGWLDDRWEPVVGEEGWRRMQ